MTDVRHPEHPMVSVGSCPSCGGPAQFVVPADTIHSSDCPFPSDLCSCRDPEIREVKLPNIDEDLGDGWKLDSLLTWAAMPGPKRYRAFAMRPGKPGAEGFGESPSQAYLALLTAIEAAA